jgi:hypothetical protein
MGIERSDTAGPHRPDQGTGPARREVPERSGRPRPESWLAALALLPLGLFASAAWLGRWVRPGGDDWCFLPVVRDGGLAAMVGKFYFDDNGRVANAVLVWAYARFGVAGHQWFGLISGLIVLGVLWAVTALAVRRASLAVPRGVPLLVASVVTALFLFASPNTYKTFFWPAASVSHTLAPVLACAAALPLLAARSPAGRAVALAVVFTAGAVIGTLSEETAIVATVILSFALLLNRRTVTERARSYARAWCLTGIAGLMAGTAVLVTSPGSRERRDRHSRLHSSLLEPETWIDSLEVFARIMNQILGTWQYLGAAAAGALLGLFATRTCARALAPNRTLLAWAGVLAFLLSGYLCSVAAYPAFGPGVVSSTRLWNDFLFQYLVLLTGLGFLLGRTLRRLNVRAGAGVAAGAAVCTLACVSLAFPLADLGDAMRARAGVWDRQDQWLRARAADGARVAPYYPTPVGGMTEPFGRQGKRLWPGQCVADYYHLEHITRADSPPRS